MNATNQTETLQQLNERFADALLPLTITFGVFILFGFVGNSLILLVFSLSREYRNNNFKTFVLSLGIIDLITCVTLIPVEMVKQRHYFDFGDVRLCKLKCFFNVFGASASCLVLLVISIDRFRKVLQPLKKQLTPGLAIKILIVVAFVFPTMFAVPGTIMCGIEKTNKTNIYGGVTEVYLCATEEKYRFSIWRTVYKFSLLVLLGGISITYVILYFFVMREVTKQLMYISSQKKSTYDGGNYTSCSEYESNVLDVAVKHDVGNDVIKFQTKKSVSLESPEKHKPSGPIGDVNDSASRPSPAISNGSGTSEELRNKRKRMMMKHSKIFKSVQEQVPILQRKNFPSKTFIWFILTIVFIATYLTNSILSLKLADVVYMTPHEFAVQSFFFRIYFVNHMINPIVYAIFHKRFRELCLKLGPNIKQKITDVCCNAR